MTFADRIREVRESRDETPTAFARTMGVSHTAANDWENGKTKSLTHRNALMLEKKTGYNSEWVNFDRGPKKLIDKNLSSSAGEIKESADRPYNSEKKKGLTGAVPVISWIKAGDFTEADDITDLNDTENYTYCTVKHSPHTFALTVVGDSMTAPFGLTVPEGYTVIVDPEQRGSVLHGDLIIAKVSGEKGVNLKQYQTDGVNHWLRALNPKYDPIRAEFRVLGKVIQVTLEL